MQILTIGMIETSVGISGFISIDQIVVTVVVVVNGLIRRRNIDGYMLYNGRI